MRSGRRAALGVLGASLSLVVGCLLVTHEDDSIYGGEVDASRDGGALADATTDARAESGSAIDAGDARDAGGDGASGLDARACSGEAGPPGVRWDPGQGCIDSTEVTLADFIVFVEAGAPPLVDGNDCPDLATILPDNWQYQAGYDPAAPVTEITWCTARAYCAWAGKRLCGGLGGGGAVNAAGDGLISQDFLDPNRSEWARACTMAGSRVFPYGDEYEAGTCNGADGPGGGNLVDAGSLPGCQGGYPGIFDMSGNAFEWLDACDQDSGNCMVVGGSITRSGAGQMSCRSFVAQQRRDNHDSDVGIRCCSN
jgi:hypothetical protein